MKKKILKLAITFSCIAGGLFFAYSTQNEKELSELAFENVDALAAGEEDDANFQYYGHGDIDCYGMKVEVKFTGFRLDIE